MDIKLDRIIDNMFFKEVTSGGIEKILSEINVSQKKYKKGEVIFQEGDMCNSLGLIINGSIELHKIFPSGKFIVIKQLKSNDVFGEALLFSKTNSYPATIIAGKECCILYITKSQIIEIFTKNKKLMENFISLLSEKVVMLNKKIESISMKSVKEKVVTYILNQSSDQKSDTFVMNLSKEKISELLGIPRPSFSRELSKLKEKGLITYDRKSITIIDEEELENELL